MNQFSMACALSAILCISTTAFAQDNPPSSNTGLQAGDNVQTQNQSAGTTANPGMAHQKKMKHKTASPMDGKTPGMGSATPSGPGAPVTASGSGQ